MTKVIITIGISASGKSYFANQEYEKDPLGVRIICRDWLRHQLLDERLGKDHSVYNMHKTPTNIWKVWKFNGKDEKIITDWWWSEFESAVKGNYKKIICADTNLNRNRLDHMKQRMRDEYGVTDIEEMMFDISLEEAIKRDNARPDGVGMEVIVKQWHQFQDMKNFGEKYVPVSDSRKALLCDIDGTAAIMKNRGPFEWNKVHQDERNDLVYHIVRGFYQQGYEIVYISGRDGCCYDITYKWLEDNNFPITELIMRTPNDSRKDSTVKNELFWSKIARKYDVIGVIDDRPQVIHMWMSIGIKPIIVGNPWSSF
jgi:predicted kinase